MAAPGLARPTYCSTESRSRLATCVHFSRTLALPPLHHRLVFHELAGFGFHERVLHLTDEPFLVVEVAFDRLIYHPCPRTAHGMGETIDAFERAALHADRGCFLDAHIRKEYIRIHPIANPGQAQGAKGPLARMPLRALPALAKPDAPATSSATAPRRAPSPCTAAQAC